MVCDHGRGSESPSYDSLNERFYDSEETSLKLDKLVQYFGKKHSKG